MSLFEISGASNISKDDYESSAQEGERSNSIIFKTINVDYKMQDRY